MLIKLFRRACCPLPKDVVRLMRCQCIPNASACACWFHACGRNGDGDDDDDWIYSMTGTCVDATVIASQCMCDYVCCAPCTAVTAVCGCSQSDGCMSSSCLCGLAGVFVVNPKAPKNKWHNAAEDILTKGEHINFSASAKASLIYILVHLDQIIYSDGVPRVSEEDSPGEAECEEFLSLGVLLNGIKHRVDIAKALNKFAQHVETAILNSATSDISLDPAHVESLTRTLAPAWHSSSLATAKFSKWLHDRFQAARAMHAILRRTESRILSMPFLYLIWTALHIAWRLLKRLFWSSSTDESATTTSLTEESSSTQASAGEPAKRGLSGLSSDAASDVANAIHTDSTPTIYDDLDSLDAAFLVGAAKWCVVAAIVIVFCSMHSDNFRGPVPIRLPAVISLHESVDARSSKDSFGATLVVPDHAIPQLGPTCIIVPTDAINTVSIGPTAIVSDSSGAAVSIEPAVSAAPSSVTLPQEAAPPPVLTEQHPRFIAATASAALSTTAPISTDLSSSTACANSVASFGTSIVSTDAATAVSVPTTTSDAGGAWVPRRRYFTTDSVLDFLESVPDPCCCGLSKDEFFDFAFNPAMFQAFAIMHATHFCYMIYHALTVPPADSSSWYRYQYLYYRVMNSGIPVFWSVSASALLERRSWSAITSDARTERAKSVARRVAVFSLFLVPPFFSHIAPAFVMYLWISIPICLGIVAVVILLFFIQYVFVLGLCVQQESSTFIVRPYAFFRLFWFSMIDLRTKTIAVLWRFGVVLIGVFSMQAMFHYSVLYYGGVAYSAVPVTEFQTRNTVCFFATAIADSKNALSALSLL